MYKLSPSDFAYLYEECKLCYYLKVKYGIVQPSMPMPGVFSAINTRIQGNLIGKNLKTLSSDLPDGVVVNQEGLVESIPIPKTNVFIKGKYDLLIEVNDKNSILVDLKISQPHENKVDKYKAQLFAYKFALENPKYGKPINITRLGLIIFYPDKISFENNEALLTFPPKWLEVPIDKAEFFAFIKDVDKLLSGDPPPESPNCKWCQYRHAGETLSHPKPVQQDIPF
jgi:CRISPR/Cas system-associated exonuclease Cas4 (RecB family)